MSLVKNDDGKLTLTVADKLKAWQSHYQNLLSVEFSWNAANTSAEVPVEGPATMIIPEMVSKAISKMKSGKAAGPSGITIEMIKAAGEGFYQFYCSIFVCAGFKAFYELLPILTNKRYISCKPQKNINGLY